MDIPNILFGGYNDILKKLRSLKYPRAIGKNVTAFFDKITKPENMMLVTSESTIIMEDGGLKRNLKNSFFPFLFSDYLFGCADSELKHWYMEKALQIPWCQLSMMASNTTASLLFNDNKEYSRLFLDSVCSRWDKYMELGRVFYFCDDYIQEPSGLIHIYREKKFFSENNYALNRMIFEATGLEETHRAFENFPVYWESVKKQSGLL